MNNDNEENEEKEVQDVQEQLKNLENKQTENYSFSNRDEYIKALDNVLNTKHIQKRDLGNGKTQRYYSIAVQKAIADFMFQEWNVVESKPIPVNEKFITIQVKITFVPSYPCANEEFCSGIAAILLNSSKNNLEYQLPAATSRAIGDALKLKGNIFGRNLSTMFNKDMAVPDDFSVRKNVKKAEPEKPNNEPEKPNYEPEKPKPEPKKKPAQVKPEVSEIPDDEMPF